MQVFTVRIKMLLVAMVLGLLSFGSAQATPISTNTWYLGAFDSLGGSVTGAGFSAVGAIDPGSPAWTFTLSDNHVLEVLDCCGLGDAFEVFNFGSSLGITSIGTATCNSAAACDAAGPSFSRGDFLLGAGSYSITMNVTSYIGSPGNLFFNVKDVTDVPEPATLALLGLGLAGLGLSRRKKA